MRASACDGVVARVSAGSGDDLHRRSLYTFRKRTVPPPQPSAFITPTARPRASGRITSNSDAQMLAS